MACLGTIHAQNTLSTYLREIMDKQEKGFLITAKLIDACQLLDTLDLQADEKYEELVARGMIPDLYHNPYYDHPYEMNVVPAPKTRKYGYTLFAETDETWEALLGMTYDKITVEHVKDYVLNQGFYPEGLDNADFTDKKNVLNLFVTYHLLSRKLTPERLVNHVNERGYDPNTPEKLTVPVCEYYVTMGQRRLLRAYESHVSQGVCLNRFPILDNSRQGSGMEIMCEPDATGIRIDKEKAVCPSDNAIIYPISQVLAYDSKVRDHLMMTRMRHDFAGMFDELANNDLRLNLPIDHPVVYFPHIYDYYIEGLTYNDDGYTFYENYSNSTSPEMNRDVFSVYGRYDITFRIPPVPVAGTYEIRLGITSPSQATPITQVSVGTDPEYLSSQEIPMLFNLSRISEYGWTADTGMDEADQMMDNELHYHGMMKAPKSIGDGTTNIRDSRNAYRKILVTTTMDPDKTYYIRLKNMMDSEKGKLNIDYLEICPKNVYDNPFKPEDIW